MPFASLEARREYYREQNKKYPEKVREWKKKYREANREKLRIYSAKYLEENREKINKKQRTRHLTKGRDYMLRRTYGITLEQWDGLFTSQGKRCATCPATEPGARKGWHTDHCHTTGKVRGILCQRCNLTAGHVKDDITVLQNLIDYIRRHQDGSGHSS